MPNPLSWFFHHLPGRAHKVEVLANHFAQLVVPFFLFAPQPIASVAGGIIVLTQTWLILSGNFSWLNFITIVLAIFAFSDSTLGHVLPFDRPRLAATPTWFEIILEGTDDPAATAATSWREYEFKGKPGDPKRIPPQVAPYHLRLDWLMWFAAMGPPERYPWIIELVARLLQGDRPTLKLLRDNPFAQQPPALVRARLFRYRFTTRAERRETGAWWARTPVGEYLPPLALDAAGALTVGPVSTQVES
jgi:hypothetical protein